MVVTDLKAANVPDDRSPRQTKHDASLPFEGVKFDLMLAGPVILRR